MFIVPFLINLTMSLADESFDLAKCWNNAEDVAKLGEDSTYVDTTDKPKQDIILTPDDYKENGTP